MVRDKVKKHGIQKMIDGYIPIKKDKIVIIDDVFTTGTCISNIVKILNKTKARIIAGYVVVSRGSISNFIVPIKSSLTLAKLTK
jgi:orotate phosphoribosyltransferase